MLLTPRDTWSFLKDLFPAIPLEVVQIYGGPGSGRTTFLTQLVRDALQKGEKVVFVGQIDVRQVAKKLGDSRVDLDRLIIFQPRTFVELVEALDDFELMLNPEDHRLLIKDLFRRKPPEDTPKSDYLITQALSTLRSIGSTSPKPAVFTNEARTYSNLTYPYLNRKIELFLDTQLRMWKSTTRNLLMVTPEVAGKQLEPQSLKFNPQGILELP